MSRRHQKQHPDQDEAEPGSGLTDALKAGTIATGVFAGASSQQPPAPTVNNYYVDNRTFQLNNHTFQQSNRTVVINPPPQSNQYPYQHIYPPYQPFLTRQLLRSPGIPIRAQQHHLTDPELMFSKDGYESDEYDPYQRSSQYERSSTASQTQIYFSSKDQRSSQYERSSTASQIQNYSHSKDGYESDEYDPYRRSSQYERSSTASQIQSYSYSKDGYESDESDPDQRSSRYERSSTASQIQSYLYSKDGNESDPDHGSSQYEHSSTASQIESYSYSKDGYESDPDQRSSQYECDSTALQTQSYPYSFGESDPYQGLFEY